MATVIHRVRYGIGYGSIRHRSELARRRCGGGAMAGADPQGMDLGVNHLVHLPAPGANG